MEALTGRILRAILFRGSCDWRAYLAQAAIAMCATVTVFGL